MNRKRFNRLISFLLVLASLLSLLPANVSFAVEVPFDGIEAKDVASINQAISALQETELQDDFGYAVSAPVTQAFDLQPLYEAITEAAEFTKAGGFASGFYNAFLQRLQEAVILYNNCNDPEQVGELDLTTVEKSAAKHAQVLSAYCRILSAMDSAGNSDEQQLIAALNALDAAVPNNEFVYVSDYGAGNVAGEYFIVNELQDSNGKSVFYALDPITPSLYGKMTAKKVTLVGTAGTGKEALRGTALAGLHPEMALTFEWLETSGSTGRYNIRVGGEYNYLSTPTYINCWPQQFTATTGYQTDLLLNTVNKYSDISSRMNLDVRSNGRVSFTYITPKDGTSSTYCQYIALNTLTPEGDVYFEINTNSSNVAGSQTVYETYYKDKLPMVSSHLFRRLANRVYTDQLRDSLLSYAEFLDGDSRYEQETYTSFLSALQEMIALYVSYNGIDTDNRDVIEAELLEMQEDMISVTSMLKINKQSEAGTKINSFKASVYRWDEAEYNALTLAKDTASTKKGFYFTSAAVVPTGVTLPIWSDWKTGAGYCEYISGVKKESRRYAIDSGLVKETITSTGSIINTSKTLEGIDLWAKTTLTSNGTKVRDVYNNVSVPFIYDNATGYYTLDSDTNGVYFDGTPQNNASLKLADRPLSYSRYYSVPETGSYVGSDERTYDINSEYITGFQPFAEISLRDWKSYPSSSVAANANPDQMVDSYLVHGVAASNGRYAPDYGDLGQPLWGVGMQLEVPFRITEDGKLDGEPITFNFSGDDDVWVYIDNELVLDIGGVHDAIQGKIDFSTGTIYVSSAAHGYIRDNSGAYGKDTGLYNLGSVYTVQNSDGTGGVQYGGSLGHMSVISMKDGSTPVRMYQENLYTKAINGTAASADQIKAFSEEGSHTLKIYYMDRGRGRTNCKISFNLPTTDTVVVEKDICDTYGNLQTGGRTELSIPDNQMQNLLNQSYGFTIYRNDEPMANALYSIMEDDVEVGSGTTDANGHFTLLGKQTAEFRGEELHLDNEYRVEEDALKGNWIAPTYSYRYSGTQSNAAVSGEGNRYAAEGDPDASETLQLICTNYYSIAADPVDVVVDYGKPVEVEFRSRAMATSVSKPSFATASVRAELENPEHAAYGDFELFDSNGDNHLDSLRYTPKDLLPGIITIYCIFNVGGSLGEAPIPVRIIPATTVYYETDFSESAFDNKVVGNDDESRQWQTIVESSSGSEGTTETQSIELQDGGYTQEYIEEFVFDRGGEIPSNAFFADFNNDDESKDRYSRDRTYKNTSVANGYINYDEASDGKHATKWCYNSNRTTQPTLWWARGRMHFYMIEGTDSVYVQTGTSLQNNFQLNYHPEPEHFVQVRFRMRNVVPKTEGGNGVMTMHYYIGGNHTEDKNDGTERAYTPGSATIPNSAFYSGDFITLTIPMSSISAEHTKITSIRIAFNNLKSAEGATGEFEIDYVYCGPSTSRTGALGMDQETSYAPYLYFNFSNNVYDSRRYSNESAYGGITDYDSNKERWVISTNTNTNKNEHINFSCSKIEGGIASFNAGPRYNSSGQYGSYISPSKNKENFPWDGDTGDYCLNFYPNKSVQNYAIVRFKLTDMKEVSGQTAALQFSLIDSNNAVKHPSVSFTFSNGTWIEKAVPLNASLNSLSSCIKSIYVRIANVTTKSNTTYGKIEIDYIYVGMMIDDNTNLVRESGYTYDANSTSLYVDFTNTTYDQDRYKHRAYAHTNLDTASGWNNTYWYNYNFNNSKGVLTLTPTANHNGWGQIEANTSARDALLNYRMTGNDYAVVRMRHTGLSTGGGTSTDKPELKFLVGSSSKAGLPNDPDDANYPNIVGYYFNKSFSTSNNGKWVTYVMDLSSQKSNLGSKITFFRLIFNEVSCSKIEIDYIYIGPLLNSDPPEDTMYFGFDNTQADKDRYNSATYNYINYDNPSNVSKFNFVNVASASIDNTTGTMTMLAKTDGTYTTFGFSPSNTLRYHPKTKTVQMRFKLEDFVLSSEYAPNIYLQYGTSNTHAGPSASFAKSAVTDGKYVTVMLDLNESVAADFNNLKYTDRLRFIISGIKNAEGKQGKITVDYVYIGPRDEMKTEYHLPVTYGYDSSYESDLTYSNNSTLMVDGSGIPVFNQDYTINTEATKAFTVSTFTFTGMGFDIISRTGEDQGLIRAMIYDQEGNFVQAAQVLNKSDSGLELNQVPVLSVKMKDKETGEPLCGTFTVKLYVAEAYDFDDSIIDMGGMLDRGGQFYFDAVRIYNTIDTNADTNEAKETAAVYRRHGEADATYEEIRQLLMDAETFSPVVDGSSVNGVVFLDSTDKEPTLANYISYGPNNEVYLAEGNAISFRLDVGSVVPASVDIGAKSVDGRVVSMRIIADSKPGTSGGQTFSVATGVEQNYAITFDSTDWISSDGENYTYITIVNDGDGLLSLCKLKSAYNVITQPAQRSVRMMVDHVLTHAVQCQMEKTYEKLPDGMHNVRCDCGEEYTESHSFDEGICLCGALAPEHSYDAVVTAPTCTEQGYTTYICSVCGDNYVAGVVSSIGHSYTYTDSGEQHTVGCANCDYSATEEHSYAEGACICGAIEANAPTLDTDLTFNTSISVGSEMQVVYTIQSAKLEGFEHFYLEVTKIVANSESVTTIFSLDNENLIASTHPISGAVVGYTATYTGIFASEMGDNFTATLYAVASDATIHYGNSVTSSIKDCLYEKIETGSAELKTLAVDMLNYGAAAQVYFGYDVENLVNADLTEAQKALGTQKLPDAVNRIAVSGTGYNISTNTSLQSKVLLYLTCLYASDENSNPRFVIKDADGKLLGEATMTMQTEKACQGLYENVGARQMRELLTIELYDGDTLVSKTLTWSVESYVASIRADQKSSPELIAVANAMLIYGDSAAVYLEATGQ